MRQKIPDVGDVPTSSSNVSENRDHPPKLRGSHITERQVEFQSERVGHLAAGGEEMRDSLRELAILREGDAGKKMLLSLLPAVIDSIGSGRRTLKLPMKFITRWRAAGGSQTTVKGTMGHRHRALLDEVIEDRGDAPRAGLTKEACHP